MAPHNHDHHNHQENDQHTHQDHTEHHRMMMQEFRTKFWINLLLTIPILVLAPLFQDLFGYTIDFTGVSYVLAGLATIVFFYGGFPFLKGLYDEVKSKQPGMMTLIGLAITVAWAYSSAVTLGVPGKTFFWELASLVVIMLLGHWMEMKSVIGASNALKKLAELMPDEARLVHDDGSEEAVSVDSLASGNLIRIKPGEKMPADGVVEDGQSAVNESMLTGESKPVTKQKGDEVIGGAINEQGTLVVKVSHTGEDSYLSKVIGMVQEAQQSKSNTQHLADKAALILTIVAIGVGLATLSGWLIAGFAFVTALERMVTVMVITCPHALGLAIPLVVSISTAISARNGLLIRNRTAFENARNIDVVLFDKTGTLTTGEFGVTSVEGIDEDWREEDVLKYAAAIEANSEHPLAAGILKKVQEKEVSYPQAEAFENITGQGIKATVDGKDVRLVGPHYLGENAVSVPSHFSEQSGAETVIFLMIDHEVKGRIALADQVRDVSKEATQKLQQTGIKVYMVTGDSESVARAVSEELGMDGYYAGVLPDRKQDKVKELQGQGLVVAMTGDGVNDAPALAQADVGIAIGSGTDVAAETADIILVNSNPMDVTNLILFGRSTYRKMVQNLIWATAYNVVAIPLAAGVLYKAGIMISPAVGAIVMSLSTIIVAINAQLLRRKLET